MIVAHFGPGLWERIELQGVILSLFSIFARLATPTFIVVFGFTLAFAYLPKAQLGQKALRVKLITRSVKVLFAAIFISIPAYIGTLSSEYYWADSLLLDLLLNTYSVLIFYAMAIFCAGLTIGYMAHSPYITPLVGAGLIFIGTYLGYDSWRPMGENLLEIARLLLVSGKYAFFVNFGVVLMIVGFGWRLSLMREEGQNVRPILVVTGLTLLLVSLSAGRIVGWRTLNDLHSGYGAPPQIWYLSAVCGVMFLCTALFDKFRIPFVSFFFEHTGRNPLSIYVAHCFVLPGVEFLRFYLPNISSAAHIAFPMLIFASYWLYLVLNSRLNSLNAMASRA